MTSKTIYGIKMGINYYLLTNVCDHCGRGDEKIHLGKISAGWAFSFRGYRNGHIDGLPEGIEKVESFEEWADMIRIPNTAIEDEYGAQLDKEEFIESVLRRPEKIKASSGKEPLYHAQYMEDHEYGRYFDDEMINGHSFSFNEFS